MALLAQASEGQAIIRHAHLLHRGDKQNDPMRSRFSQLTHYYFAPLFLLQPLGSVLRQYLVPPVDRHCDRRSGSPTW
jgi:hypothetical protein